PIFASGSPYWAMFTVGRFTSGGAMIVGSMLSFGFMFAITCCGGVNCRKAGLGSLPFAAGSGERSPPPPPPPITCFVGVAMGGGARSIGANQVMDSFTLSCTVFDENTVNINATTHAWAPVDIIQDFRWRPYSPQISFTATGFEVTSRGGSLGGLNASLMF